MEGAQTAIKLHEEAAHFVRRRIDARARLVARGSHALILANRRPYLGHNMRQRVYFGDSILDNAFQRRGHRARKIRRHLYWFYFDMYYQ